jgi:AcrR family transcriptional regulator
MSIEAPRAKQPKRERGKQRVAALLDAGAALFAEKGYEAATMTEIAQRAGASIGSLYQFFPSKDALAEALFNRYVERMGLVLDGIAGRAAGLRPAQLADLLVDLMLDMRADRDVAMTLLNSVAAVVESRKPPRYMVRSHVAAVLRAAKPGMSDEQSLASATVVTQFIKTVPVLAEAEEHGGQGFVQEARRMLTLYLERILDT